MGHFSLSNKVAFITGGCSGIGLAVAKRYIESGADVILADIHDGDGIADKIGATYIELDVTNEQMVKSTLSEIATNKAKIDILINNAGVGDLPGTIEEGDTAIWKKLIDINMYGVLYGLKYGPRNMNDGGSIINTSSQAAMTKLPGGEPYAATKAAVLSLTQTSAIEVGPRQIRVNAVCPTYTYTPMTADTWDDEGALVKTLSAMNKTAGTEDMIGIFHFLGAKESSLISGQSFVIDAGWTAGISYGAINAILKK